MKRDRSSLRQRLRRIEASRAAHVEKILSVRRPLRRGSFLSLRHKCGRPNCHCASGEGHPAQYLSIKEGGRTRMVYVPGHLAASVAKEARRYRRLRQARAMLAKLARESLQAIDELERALETTEEIVGRKRTGRSPGRKP